MATAKEDVVHPKNPWSTPFDLNIVASSPVGSGAFGSIWIAKHFEDETTYAIKRVNISKALRDFSDLDKIKREVDCHTKLRSSFVIQYYTYWIEEDETKEDFKFDQLSESAVLDFDDFDDTDTQLLPDIGPILYIQMEYCSHKTLTDFLKENNTIDLRSSEINRLFSHLAKGLSAIHKEDIIHRDLKPDNILRVVSSDVGGGGEGMSIWKIGDFGLSIIPSFQPRQFFETLENFGVEEPYNFNEDDDDDGLDDDNPTFRGTYSYRSPEMVEESCSYNEKTDIFSLGLIFMEILSPHLIDPKVRKLLFHQVRQGGSVVENFIHNLNPTFSKDKLELISPVLEILPKMLSIDELTRPTSLEIFQWVLCPVTYCVPHPVLDFMGRDAELVELHEYLTRHSKIVMVTSDKYGTGKTQFVKKYVQKYIIEKHTKMNVLFLDAKNRAGSNLRGHIYKLSTELDISSRMKGLVNIKRNAEHILHEICKSLTDSGTFSKFPSLLILDGINAGRKWALDQIERDHSFRNRNRVIIVGESDFNFEVDANSSFICIKLCPFSPGVAEACAKQVYEEMCLPVPPELAWHNFCNFLEFHPQALKQAKLILHHLLPQDQHADFVNNIVFKLQLISASRIPLENSEVFAKRLSSLYAYSLQQMLTHSGYLGSLKILQILICLYGKGTLLSTLDAMFTSISDNDDKSFSQSLQLLQALDLITVTGERYIEFANDLIPDVIIAPNSPIPEWDTESALRGMACIRAIAKQTRLGIMDSMYFWMHAVPKTKQIVTDYADFVDDTLHRLNETSLSNYFDHFAQLNIEQFTDLLGIHDIRTIRLEFQLAIAMRKNEQDLEALWLNRDLLKRCKKIKVHPANELYVTIRDEIASGLIEREKLDGALRLLRLNLSRQEENMKDLESERILIATKNSIAKVLIKQKKYDECVPLLKQILHWRKVNLGHKHLVTINTMGDLADCYFHQGKFELAKNMFEHVLKGVIGFLGEENHAKVESINYEYMIASCLDKLGDKEGAQELFRWVDAAKKIMSKSNNTESSSTKLQI
ncbi:uncharacterized protein LOC110845036 [Folsomia candida]|uniref:Interferon-induced, double-stranded RNA-activated protein kinase n=1 Tax=Folsomia candida TaxID=158441 RepID=A0A226ES87_FOLCA|nr:uncharacterized protein LOC110845036 [Folsomia candida]XP_035704129.1 uncharacterized protein LOC110845036 [Folsomia candida]OXA59456.1 Interferon-induced, double-stranded RNA-activated protein kinase [Folsomia candida]